VEGKGEKLLQRPDLPVDLPQTGWVSQAHPSRAPETPCCFWAMKVELFQVRGRRTKGLGPYDKDAAHIRLDGARPKERPAGLFKAVHDVHGVHSLSCRSFHQVVDGGDHDESLLFKLKANVTKMVPATILGSGKR